jgi:hypothetical protein
MPRSGILNKQCRKRLIFTYRMFVSTSGRIRRRRIRRRRSSTAVISATGSRSLLLRRTRLRSYRVYHIRFRRIRRSSTAAAVSKCSCCLQRNRPYQDPLSLFIVYYMTIQEYRLQITPRYIFLHASTFLSKRKYIISNRSNWPVISWTFLKP